MNCSNRSLKSTKPGLATAVTHQCGASTETSSAFARTITLMTQAGQVTILLQTILSEAVMPSVNGDKTAQATVTAV
jgi:hypothetical protein